MELIAIISSLCIFPMVMLRHPHLAGGGGVDMLLRGIAVLMGVLTANQNFSDNKI
jgi:hypothetical protein